MKNKTYHTIQDLLEDQSFNKWVLDNTSDSDFWDVWIKENTVNKNLAEEAKDIIVGINFKKETVSKEKVDLEWEKLASKLNHTTTKKVKQRQFKINYFSAAASIALLISLAVFLYTNYATVTHRTAYGEMTDVTLKDGSLVTLNSNSSISYSNNDPRTINLSGEAYFKVKKDISKKAKFKVNTKDLTVEVYGTQFNVKTLNDKTHVFLEEGSILLNLNNGKARKMIPGNYIEYSSTEKKIISENTKSVKDHIAWKSGVLTFENTTLEEALTKVSDAYGIQFKFLKSETKDVLITGKVPTTDLKICLNAIKKSTNIKIKKENSILVVY